jgi:hypothetical protein
MSDQLIANGQYRIQPVTGQGAVSAIPGAPGFALDPEQRDGSKWEVASDGAGGYTLRNVTSGLYLGGKGSPSDPAMMLEGASQPVAWKIERSPDDEEGLTLSPRASEGKLRLAPSLLKVYPPLVASLEARDGDHFQLWRLVRA